MAYRVGITWLALVMSPTIALAEDAPTISELRVETAIVRPVKSDGSYWDGVHAADVPSVASKELQAAAQRYVSKEIVGAGLATSLAVPGAKAAIFAAKWFNNAITPPDPFGELVVDGHVVAALPVIQDSMTPSWPKNVARYLPITAGSVIEVNLSDADASGAHDPIGTCRFAIPKETAVASQRLMSRTCTGDLLAATVVLSRGQAPQPTQAGAYRIAVARAGVQSTKPDGLPWDPSGIGDPKIRIDVDGQSLLCPVNQGQHAGVCEPNSFTFQVSGKTSITFRVVDADAVFDDFIGTAAIGDLLTKEAGRPIVMTTTGGLTWAEVVIEPVVSPPAAPGGGHQDI